MTLCELREWFVCLCAPTRGLRTITGNGGFCRNCTVPTPLLSAPPSQALRNSSRHSHSPRRSPCQKPSSTPRTPSACRRGANRDENTTTSVSISPVGMHALTPSATSNKSARRLRNACAAPDNRMDAPFERPCRHRRRCYRRLVLYATDHAVHEAHSCFHYVVYWYIPPGRRGRFHGSARANAGGGPSRGTKVFMRTRSGSVSRCVSSGRSAGATLRHVFVVLWQSNDSMHKWSRMSRRPAHAKHGWRAARSPSLTAPCRTCLAGLLRFFLDWTSWRVWQGWRMGLWSAATVRGT